MTLDEIKREARVLLSRAVRGKRSYLQVRDPDVMDYLEQTYLAERTERFGHPHEMLLLSKARKLGRTPAMGRVVVRLVDMPDPEERIVWEAEALGRLAEVVSSKRRS